MRYALKKWRLYILAAALLLGPAAGLARADTTTDREQLQERIAQNAILQIDYWGMAWADRPLAGRIHPAPPLLVEKIRLENRLMGYQERPVPVAPPPEIAVAVEAIRQQLPSKIRTLLDRRLIGIFTVDQLGGTGYSEVIFNRDQEEYYGIIVVDAALLKKKRANDWAAWKINSMFRPETGSSVRIRAIMENGPADSTVNSIRFILLHEFGHILGMATRIHPSWLETQAGGPAGMSGGFPEISWKVTADNRRVSRHDARFPERSRIRAYAFEKAELPISRAPVAYANLVNHSDFPTLYACESLWEDFAESFATYFHVVIDRRPWQIVIEQDGRPDRVIGSCWGTPRCRAKEQFLERWFADPTEK